MDCDFELGFIDDRGSNVSAMLVLSADMHAQRFVSKHSQMCQLACSRHNPTIVDPESPTPERAVAQMQEQ
jgi:hypothetical protein